MPHVDQDPGVGMDCGMGSCRPKGLQFCASMWAFSAVYSLSGLGTSTLAVYINSQVTTLEKQFGFSSSVTGFLLSCNDIGFLLTTLFMSYIARRTHIPRILGLSTILFGVSGLLCSVPYFVTKDNLYPPVNTTEVTNHGSLEQHMCGGSSEGMITRNVSNGDICGQSTPGTESIFDISKTTRNVAISLIAIGMMLQGIGKSPRYPFIATYVDDNVEKTKTTLYLGLIMGAGIFGPALGYTMGGIFSKMYVTLEETSMTPRDPRWIGAWWLGFVVFGLVGIVVGLPLFFFPRRMKQRNKVIVQDELKRKKDVCTNVRGLVAALFRLAMNPIYMCIVLASCCSLFAASGVLAFLPKYLEIQYLLPAWKANMLLGGVNIVGAAGGTMVGGAITTKFKLSPLACLKLLVGLTIVVLIFNSSGFFLGCPQPQLIGDPDLPAESGSSNLTCDATCACIDESYFPVCGENGVNYYSPCHAGCNGTNGQSYTSCSCIPGNSSAVPGLCVSQCGNLYPYLTTSFFGAFLGTFGMMPSILILIRCVPEVDKPLALGMSAFLQTLLGWFPGPVVFGKIMDTACLRWASTCSGPGACFLYSLVLMKDRLHLAWVLSRTAGLGLYVGSLVVAVRKTQPVFMDENDSL